MFPPPLPSDSTLLGGKTPPLPCHSTAPAAKTPPLPSAETLRLHCVSTAPAAKTLPLPSAKTPPLHRVPTAAFGQDPPLPCVTAAHMSSATDVLRAVRRLHRARGRYHAGHRSEVGLSTSKLYTLATTTTTTTTTTHNSMHQPPRTVPKRGARVRRENMT